MNQSVSFLYIPNWRVHPSFSVWRAGLQIQFPTAVSQASYFSKLHVKAGNQSRGGCSWAPTCGAAAPGANRSGFPLLTLQWWRPGGIARSAPGIHWIQRSKSSGPVKQMQALRKPSPQFPWLFLLHAFSTLCPSPSSFCLFFSLSLPFCDLKKVTAFTLLQIPGNRRLKLMTTRLFMMFRFFNIYRNTCVRNLAVGNFLLLRHFISRLLPASLQMKTLGKDWCQETAGEELLRERPGQVCGLAEHLSAGFHTHRANSSPSISNWVRIKWF